MAAAVHDEAQAFLSAWFNTRQIIQTMNFNNFQQEGLSATQFVLTMLGEAVAPDTSPADLARRLNVDVTSTMRTADSLTARGLLRKRRDPADRRRSLLTLTAAGRKVRGRIHSAFIDQVIATFQSMSAIQRSGLVEGLSAFVAVSAAKNGRDNFYQ